jgi:hypothetical protein
MHERRSKRIAHKSFAYSGKSEYQIHDSSQHTTNKKNILPYQAITLEFQTLPYQFQQFQNFKQKLQNHNLTVTS